MPTVQKNKRDLVSGIFNQLFYLALISSFQRSYPSNLECSRGSEKQESSPVRFSLIRESHDFPSGLCGPALLVPLLENFLQVCIIRLMPIIESQRGAKAVPIYTSFLNDFSRNLRTKELWFIQQLNSCSGSNEKTKEAWRVGEEFQEVTAA